MAPLLIFTLSVVVTAWYGGLGPGILATVLGALLGAYFFIEPHYTFRIYSGPERMETVLFLGIGISISLLSQTRLSLLEKRQRLLASERDVRRAAEDASRLKDEFLCAVSHELRTPLTAINGWALMLRAGRLDAAQSERAIETIVSNVRAQNQIISDLLDVSRIITGKMSLDVAPLNLGSVINAAV